MCLHFKIISRKWRQGELKYFIKIWPKAYEDVFIEGETIKYSLK